MLDPKADKSEKLKDVRSLFTDAVEHHEKSRSEMHRASRFFHNTDQEGQWEWEDLRSLRDEGRPAFSFNLIAPKIRSWIGQYQDGKRRPQVVAKGRKALLAEGLEKVCDSIYQDLDMDAIDGKVLEVGVVKGERNWHVDVAPDPKRPEWVEVSVTGVSPHDVMWDPGSSEPDKSDANHVFWSRWLTKNEFMQDYPDFDWKQISTGGGDDDPGSGISSDRHEHPSVTGWNEEYSDIRENAYFYDRKSHKVRVVHCEYIVPVKRHYMINPQTGISEEMDEQSASLAKRMQKQGSLTDAEIIDVWDEIVYTLEFTGHEILWESDKDNPYQPYDGFSLVPFVCHFDDESGTAYGSIRNMFDPQMEVNKARSVTLEQLSDQPKTGIIGEQGMVDDHETFDDQVHTSGETAWVKDGAVTTSRFHVLQLPQVSPASIERLSTSLDLFERIANIETEIGNPGAAAEAATTHLIRYNRSRQGQRPIIANYEKGQRTVKEKVVQAIVNVMPDTQIEAILADDEAWTVKEGQLIRLHKTAEGQVQPVAQEPLRDMRSVRYSVGLETASDNMTINMIEHQGLLTLHQAGVPVPPDMLAEGATTSTSKRERLREYSRAQSASNAKAAEKREQIELGSIQGLLKVESDKTTENRRHNVETENLNFMKALSTEQINYLRVWEKADETEKKAMMEMAKIIESRQQGRGQPSEGAPNG